MNNLFFWRKSGAVLAALVLGTCGAQAVSWNGGGGNADWFNPTNWAPVGVPGTGAAVTNAAGAILLTNETAELASFTLTGGSVTFSNWTTRLRATEVDLQGGTLTLPMAFTNNVMSNRVWVVCSNFTLGVTAQIDAVGKGYRSVNGPGAATAADRTGASHGGRGGRGPSPVAMPQPYGSAAQPFAPGSGGSYESTSTLHQGAGGGAVWIQASGMATLLGAILADGADGYRYGGGGSGGSILIQCGTFAGDNRGLVSVMGGSVPLWGDGVRHSGGGGGGRVAVDYALLDGTPRVRFRGTPGIGNADQNAFGIRHRAGQGTLHVPDPGLFSILLADNQFQNIDAHVASTQIWTVASLVVSNASLTFADPGFVVSVASDVRIDAGGGLGMYGELITQAGDLNLTNGGVLRVYSDATNGLAADYGARVSITGDIQIAANSTLLAYAHSTNGGTPLFEAENVHLAAGGTIKADGGGYASQTGPGKASVQPGGGGYGGRGGGGTVGGAVYGRNNDASQPGSGGGDVNQGGFGGGCVRIVASGTVTVDGVISANGLRTWGSGGGSGSGGGIDIRCNLLAGGADGLLQANGGGGFWHSSSASWYGYAGGGGRIALHYDTLSPGFAACLEAGYDNTGAHLNNLVIGRVMRHEAGTLWAPDLALMAATLPAQRFDGVNLFLQGLTSWTSDHFAVGDNVFAFGPASFIVNVTKDLTIGAGGHLEVRGDIHVLEGDLTVASGGALTVRSAATNGLGRAYGSLVEVGGTLAVESGAWVYPWSHPTDGGSVLFRPGRLMVGEGGGFDADGSGFQWGKGPGSGTLAGAGGGYGGRGGHRQLATTGGGPVHGIPLAPTLPGSGGGVSVQAAGFGGGLVWIESTGAVSLDGTIRARGMKALSTGGGGGSGGGILLAGSSIEAGTEALLDVNGGDAVTHGSSIDPDKWYTAGGGGGRIAVWLQVAGAARTLLLAGTAAPGVELDAAAFTSFAGNVSVAGGLGYQDGEPGTIRFVDGRPRGTVILVR